MRGLDPRHHRDHFLGHAVFAFTVFIAPMSATLGYSKPFLAGGYSLGLLVWAMCSFAVGRLLDRVQARIVMCAGSVLAGCGLLLWAWSPNQAAFLLMWIPLGLAMATTLDEPAFVVLRQAFGDGYQKSIVTVTLMAGCARHHLRARWRNGWCCTWAGARRCCASPGSTCWSARPCMRACATWRMPLCRRPGAGSAGNSRRS
ncbi:hypothetical protein ACU4GD_38030, partial [Cupriavidus basilensis]